MIMTTGTGAFGYGFSPGPLNRQDHQVKLSKAEPTISEPSVHCRAPMESQRGKSGCCASYTSWTGAAGSGHPLSRRGQY
jgi:hypothetical protein